MLSDAAAADSWKAWLDDLPLDAVFSEGIGQVQDFITGTIARAEAAETALAAMTKERDELAKTNNRQAACLHYTAAELGPDYVATVDGLPKAARHALAAERAKVEAVIRIAASLFPGGYDNNHARICAAITEAGQ